MCDPAINEELYDAAQKPQGPALQPQLATDVSASRGSKAKNGRRALSVEHPE
jgi:hypothetical protein